MQKFGIDLLSFSTSDYYLDSGELALKRGFSKEKFVESLGQNKIAILPPDEDIVTMAANAAYNILQKISVEEKNSIELILFATESGIDYSKASGFYILNLLDLPKKSRVAEIKQACYGGTAALQLALNWLRQNPTKKALILASDVARYSLESAAESSQGAGAVAMLLSANPRLLTILPESGIYSQDVMDFWRPNYCREALVDGKYSCEIYMKYLEECWNQYYALTKRSFAEHAYFCYHTPVPNLVERSHQRLARKAQAKNLSSEEIQNKIVNSLIYNREIGNSYTASLYIGIASLLDNTEENLAEKNIGLYSYGSGASSEFFSGLVMNDYQKYLFTSIHQQSLDNRQALTFDQYLDFYKFKLPEDGSNYVVSKFPKSGKFRLAAINAHKRVYEAIK